MLLQRAGNRYGARRTRLVADRPPAKLAPARFAADAADALANSAGRSVLLLHDERLAAGDFDNLLRLVGNEIEGGLPGAGAIGKAVVIEQEYAARLHAPIEELKAVPSGLAQIDVDVHEAEAMSRTGRQTFRNPA